MAIEIANATDKTRFHCSVLVTRDVDVLAPLLSRDIPLHILGRTKRFDMKSTKRFLNLLHSENVSLLHVHGGSSLNFVAFASVVSRISNFHFPNILFHDHWGDIELIPEVPVLPRIFSKFLNADYVCIHQTMVESLKRHGYPANKMHFIRNAIIFDGYACNNNSLEEEIERSDPLRGVIISNLRFAKGFDVLIEAMALCKDLNWDLQIIGGPLNTDYAQYCLTKCTDHGIHDRVHFLGVRTDAVELLKTADFGVYSAHTESGPLVLIEYIAAKLPFASTKVGAVGELLDNLGVPGFVKPGDPQSLAREIRLLIEMSRKERSDRGSLGYSLSRKYLDMRNVINQWHDVYEELLRTN